MSDIKSWSETAASNNSASPNGFPEGMAPSGVNDSAREVMAAVRRWTDDNGWHNWGHTYTYASATSFTIATDLTAIYHAGRRIRAVGSTTGTIYGTISSSSYGAPNTTINVTWDSGTLQSETLAISLGYLPAVNPSFKDPTLNASQTANYVYAAPNGAPGIASFRALVAADVPTLNQNTTGTAANLSGTPALPDGTTATTQAIGDTTTKLATNAFVIANRSLPFAVLQNRQNQNTDGGTATSGSWLIIPFNTEYEDAGSIVNSSALPAFTLAAGTYRIEVICPFYACGNYQTRLYNVTDGTVQKNVNTVDMYGSCGNVGAGVVITPNSTLEGTFTLAVGKQLRVEYQVATTRATTGLGFAANFAVEVYAQAKIWKLS